MKTFTDKERAEIIRQGKECAMKCHAIMATYPRTIMGAVTMELVAYWLASWHPDDQAAVMSDFRDSGCDLILKIAKSLNAANENKSH